MRRTVLVTLSLALAAPVAAAAATGAGAEPARGVFVGRVAGTQAFVAVAVGHRKARAYLCDSRRLALWFPAGRLRAGRAELYASPVRLAVRLAGSRLAGEATLADGSVHRFRAVHATGAAGLYRARKRVGTTGYVAGWILLRGGAQRGNVLAFAPTRSTTIALQAPPLNPEAATAEIADGGVATVVKLGDSFIDKTIGD